MFYLHQLLTYKFGIHVLHDDSAVMNVWSENVTSHGCDDIGSYFLNVFPQLKSKFNTSNLIIWTDSYAGQTKNFHTVALWIYLVKMKVFDSITHRFFIPAHTHTWLQIGILQLTRRRKGRYSVCIAPTNCLHGRRLETKSKFE